MTTIPAALEKYIFRNARKIAKTHNVLGEEEDLRMEGTIAALLGGSRTRVVGAMYDYLRRQYGRGEHIKRHIYFDDLELRFSRPMTTVLPETAIAGYFLPQNWDERLTVREKEVVASRYWDQKLDAETAKELGISQGRVSQLGLSALERIKKSLKRVDNKRRWV